VTAEKNKPEPKGFEWPGTAPVLLRITHIKPLLSEAERRSMRFPFEFRPDDETDGSPSPDAGPTRKDR
jgi:hypothetical protein